MIHICYLLYYIIGLINIHVHVNMNYQNNVNHNMGI